MVFIENVHGHAEQARPVIVNVDTVYVHTNIQPAPPDEDGNVNPESFIYDEVQYTKDEYIQVLADQNVALERQLTDTQLALVEVYEQLLGGAE